jgi:glutathione S-transferase
MIKLIQGVKSMKLWTAERAANPRRVSLFLAAKGLKPADIGMEVIQVNLMTGENKTPDYLKIHPLGQIPALMIDDGQVITESTAICRYLEGMYPENPMFGSNLMEQVLINQYSRQAEIEILIPMMTAFQNSHAFWAKKIEQVPAIAPVALGRARARFAYFDLRLQQVPFLAGQSMSMADLILYAALDFGRLAGLKVDEQHPYLLAFYKRFHEQFSAVA